MIVLADYLVKSWAGGGAAGDADEAGIRGLGLALRADSVAPDARRFTCSFPNFFLALPCFGPAGLRSLKITHAPLSYSS
jgi:hypothetical protein